MRPVSGIRPHVLLSAAISLDGCLDDVTPDRLILSSDADLDRVDGVRAASDAIMVGAGTVRSDDPGLVVRSQARREARVGAGLAPSPLRVVLSGGGRLDPAARVFAADARRALVYCPDPVAAGLRAALGQVADIVGVAVEGTARADLVAVLADLADRGVRRLLVEGGAVVFAQFFERGLADALDLAVAPVLVGDPAAPRFIPSGTYAGVAPRLESVEELGGVACLHYSLAASPAESVVGGSAAGGGADRAWLLAAIEESRRCSPAPSAYSVGAIVVGPDGAELARGHSREHDSFEHAEEVALDRCRTIPRVTLERAVLYTTIEPCTTRRSRTVSCTERILASGIGRVVLALREPPLLAQCRGVSLLTAAGVRVIECPDLAEGVRQVNAHLLG